MTAEPCLRARRCLRPRLCSSDQRRPHPSAGSGRGRRARMPSARTPGPRCAAIAARDEGAGHRIARSDRSRSRSTGIRCARAARRRAPCRSRCRGRLRACRRAARRRAERAGSVRRAGQVPVGPNARHLRASRCAGMQRTAPSTCEPHATSTRRSARSPQCRVQPPREARSERAAPRRAAPVLVAPIGAARDGPTARHAIGPPSGHATRPFDPQTAPGFHARPARISDAVRLRAGASRSGWGRRNKSHASRPQHVHRPARRPPEQRALGPLRRRASSRSLPGGTAPAPCRPMRSSEDQGPNLIEAAIVSRGFEADRSTKRAHRTLGGGGGTPPPKPPRHHVTSAVQASCTPASFRVPASPPRSGSFAGGRGTPRRLGACSKRCTC